MLETAFEQIRQATGVKKLDEMVMKFEGQVSTKAALDDERAVLERQLGNYQDS